jgi:hypothetical protein
LATRWKNRGLEARGRDAVTPAPTPRRRGSGSLTRRMIGVAAIWIAVLLGAGGYALDRLLTSAITDNFDGQLEYVLRALIASSEIGPEGEVVFNELPADQRFLEIYSGLYFQISPVVVPKNAPRRAISLTLALGSQARGRVRSPGQRDPRL